MSAIEWTDETWNPIHARRAGGPTEPPRQLGWHCERVSPGCEHCYAERQNLSGRFNRGTALPYVRKSRDLVDVGLDAMALGKPLEWKRSRRVFVCSMSDLYGAWVTRAVRARVFSRMALCSQHIFQVLTKRPETMSEELNDPTFREEVEAALQADGYGHVRRRAEYGDWPLPNVWAGTSVEDQPRAAERIPRILEVPAPVHFLSCEPLLEAVDVSQWMHDSNCIRSDEIPFCICSEPREVAIDWVIVGGESGPGARPFDVAWGRSLVAQCKAAAVPCFVKQLGSNPTDGYDGWQHPNQRHPVRLRHSKGANPDEWPDDLRVREFPAAVPA